MERQNDRLRILRCALCGAAASLTAYLAGLMLWTQLMLSGVVGEEHLAAGTHLLIAAAAAVGAAVCALRGEIGAAPLGALCFWLSVLLGGMLCGGGVAPRAALVRAAACAVGMLAVRMPLRRSGKRRRGGARGKHKRRGSMNNLHKKRGAGA